MVEMTFRIVQCSPRLYIEKLSDPNCFQSFLLGLCSQEPGQTVAIFENEPQNVCEVFRMSGTGISGELLSIKTVDSRGR